MRLLTIITLTLFIATACQPYSNSDLSGNWAAIALTEEGDSLAVNLNDIAFQFEPNGRYHFSSTLLYEEAGHYRLDGAFLFSTDTTDASGKEKAVEILQLAGDTLTILMQEEGKDRVMMLKKN